MNHPLFLVTNGAFPGVYHFDSKAEVEKYIRTLPIPASFFMPGFYMSNIPGGMIAPDPSTKEYAFNFPAPESTPIPLFDAADDTGKFVKAILTHREETLGKRVLAATDYYTCTDILDGFREVKTEAGKGATFRQISEKDFKQALSAMPEMAQDEMYQNMAFMNDWGYFGKEDLGWSHSVCFSTLTLPPFLFFPFLSFPIIRHAVSFDYFYQQFLFFFFGI